LSQVDRKQMAKKIVVLTHSSLLAAGFISRLSRCSCQFETLIIDLKKPNSLQQISEFNPEFIIFDDADIKNSLYPSLLDILESNPDAILLELRVNDSNVQIIQSFRISASNAEELIKILNMGSGISMSASHLFV
jgi:hypothetical protein